MPGDQAATEATDLAVGSLAPSNPADASEADLEALADELNAEAAAQEAEATVAGGTGGGALLVNQASAAL